MLEVQGIPFTELAAEFGTPLYVYDGAVIAAQYTGLRDTLHPALEILFSLKANPNLSVCALLRSLGAGAEVSSLAELVTALRAGVPAGSIVFAGPSKSPDELSAALDAGIAAIAVESFGELAAIDALAAARGTRADVVLRVNPGFAVKGSRLTMGGRPRQFGIDEAQVRDRAAEALRYRAVRIAGVHIYLGTRILDEELVAHNTGRILDLAQHLGLPLDLVDVGGGLGVAYFDGERDLDANRLTDLLNPVVARFHDAHPCTRLVMELGRYLTAPSGTYVTAVRYVKESMGERFAVVDGGTHHHMAATGLGSFAQRNFPMALLNRAGEDTEPWQVAGALCTPNDVLGRKVALPRLRPGDLIGVRRSGAYGPTASPVRFLGHGGPAEVLVLDGRAHLVRRRDDVADLLRNQLLVEPTVTTQVPRQPRVSS